MELGRSGKCIDLIRFTGMKGNVVQSWPAAVMVSRSNCRSSEAAA